jgi:hypothetical protein
MVTQTSFYLYTYKTLPNIDWIFKKGPGEKRNAEERIYIAYYMIVQQLCLRSHLLMGQFMPQ